MPFKSHFTFLVSSLFLSAIGFAPRAVAQAPAIKSVYLTTISGSKYLIAEFRPATGVTISYQVSANLSVWSSPGINGYPNVVQSVSPTDSQVLVARLDTPVSGQNRYFFRAVAPSITLTRHPPLDFDGDGFTDWAVVHSESTAERPLTWNIAYHKGGTKSVIFGSGNTDYFVPADYDGDGICDIAVWTNPSPSQYKILQSSTGTTRVVNFGQPGDEPTVGDFDGDGKADLAVFRRGPGSEAHLYYQGSLNNPNGLTTEVPKGSLSVDSSVFLDPGDYDGDGENDLCVQGQAGSTGNSAEFSLKRSSDGGEEHILFGAPTDSTVEGDYDGDGRSDFATVSSVSGQFQWSILERDGGGTGNTPYVLGNSSTDFPVPGDYDGDGKQDIAVWSTSNAVFTVRRSSDGNLMTFAWGVNGDYPVANYQVH